MERYVIQLRKSRSDIEAEARGEGETLSKHKKALLKLASSLNLNIVKINQEIESGETLVHRPQMMQLLKEVEQNMYDGVLVMDVDRLGRGNMQEQGLILETFRASNTKIITPRKTYDLNDEFDEEYSEFEAFMARKELKIINRRLQGGRRRSVEEGNYLGTRPPYGYEIDNKPDGRTLKPHPEQSAVIPIVFDLYTNQGLGSTKIADELNKLGYKTYTGRDWNPSSVLGILKNDIYRGIIAWGKKEIKKSVDPNKKKDTRTRDKEDWSINKGKHPALIDQETFEIAQKILAGKYHVPYQITNGIQNPLASLIICAKCGTKMSKRPYERQKDHLICHNTNCDMRSSQLDYVEKALISSLKSWLNDYKEQWNENDIVSDPMNTNIEQLENAVNRLELNDEELMRQKSGLHDFLERGIYTEEVFIERSSLLADRLNDNEMKIKAARKELSAEKRKQKAQRNIIPQVKHVLNIYNDIETAAEKNDLLKTIIAKAVYNKEKDQKGDNFELVLYPRLPN